MTTIARDTVLPTKPQYVRVELDADMAPEGPLYGSKWPGAERVLTYHSFAKRKLRRGERVCVNAGAYEGCFGTVIGRSRRWRGHTFGVRRARRKTITIQMAHQIEVEIA